MINHILQNFFILELSQNTDAIRKFEDILSSNNGKIIEDLESIKNTVERIHGEFHEEFILFLFTNVIKKYSRSHRNDKQKDDKTLILEKHFSFFCY